MEWPPITLADVLEARRLFDEARERCEQLAAEHGYRYVHSGNEPHLIAGVGTGRSSCWRTSPQRILWEHLDDFVLVS